MTSILILGNMTDSQTGIYILKACKDISSNVSAIDIRRIIQEVEAHKTQKVILDEILELKYIPDIIIVMKGTELTINTLMEIRKLFPNATLVNWFFDKYLADKPIWETTSFFPALEQYDFFFCSLKGVSDKLNEIGFKNAYYIDEACDLDYHQEQYLNYYQEKKYGEDVSFVGTIGLAKQHANRIPLLSLIAKEGFRLKIWGEIACEMKYVPPNLRELHTKTAVINEYHSMVVQSSLVNLGIDQDPTLENGWSARLYRTLCAGGLYLSTPTKGLESMFNINKKGEQITGNEDLVVFYDENDLITKLDFLLERDDIRKSIALNGQKKVIEHHSFPVRMKEMMEAIKNAKTKNN